MTPIFFRTRPLRFGIRIRIVVVTLVVGSLFIFYVAFTATRQAERDLEQVREQMRLVAALAGARLDDHLGDMKQLLHALSGTLPLGGSAAEDNDATLRRLMPQLPSDVQDVSIWSVDGSNIGSSTFAAGQVRPRAGGHAFFSKALAADDVAIEAPVRIGDNGDWAAILALRIAHEDHPIAVVSVSIRLQTLASLLDPDNALNDGAVIAVSSAEGKLVARSLDPDSWIGRPTPIDRTTLLRRLAEGGGATSTTAIDGVARVFGFARARTAPWLVYVGIPTSVVGAAASESLRNSIALGVALLVLGLIISAWVAGRIAQPLRELSEDARLLGAGRFEHRSSVRTGSEVGLLAHTLNRMAGDLQERIAAARRSEERLSLALEASEQSLFDWDIAADRIYYSGRASALRGGPDEAFEASPEAMRAHVHPDDLAAVTVRIRDALRGATALYEAEFRIRRHDGSWLWIRSRGRVVERDGAGRALRMVGTDADIARRKAAEDEMRQRAELDSLTGLPNRALFNDRLAGAVERSARSGHSLALLFLDIDHFKLINDSRGHEAGDELLKIAAERLRATVRGVDTVARLAGDEFTVVLEGLDERADAERVAAKLVEALRPPMQLGASPVQVSVSIGVAWLEAGERDPAALLRRADQALYAAKRAGRDRYRSS
jgi:diguanylate cyclase (GGDEF)-like protein/PAS domain S-box-containing protein